MLKIGINQISWLWIRYERGFAGGSEEIQEPSTAGAVGGELALPI